MVRGVRLSLSNAAFRIRMNRGRVQDAAGSQKLGPFCRGVTAGSAGALDLENEISKSCNNREIFFTKGSKVASKEMKNLFSINRAADLLEKDRATLVRALRHVPPDGGDFFIGMIEAMPHADDDEAA